MSPDTAKFLRSLHTVAVLKAEIKLEKADTPRERGGAVSAADFDFDA